MSYYRIGDLGILFSQDGPMRVDLGTPGVVYPPVSTGRLWLNTDYSTQDWGRDTLFLDAMRSARPWRAQTSTQFNDDTLLTQMMATADADGYPTMLPAGVIHAGSYVLLEQAAESAPAIGGRYRMDWQGQGTVAVTGANQTSGPNWIEFDFTPTGSNSVDVLITSTQTGDHVRGMRCYMTQYASLIAAGQRVHPAFKAAYPNIKLLRWMMATDTNRNEQEHWADAPQPTSVARGPSWLEMVEVCNELGCDGWFHIPHRATSDFVTQAAMVVRDNLNPALKAYVEYSNEWWNSAWGFYCYPYLESLRAGKSYNFAEMAGGRSTEAMVAWSAVFAGQMQRTVRVAGVQTGWLGLEEGSLYAPGWVAEQPGRPVPHTVHDAIAVTGYFNCNPADWPSVISAAQTDFDAGLDALVTSIQGEIETHRTTYYPYFRTIANTLGKQLVMYEGGSHLFDPGNTGDTPLARQLVAAVNRGERVVDLYARMMTVWAQFGDGGFHQFSATRREEVAGEFGALQYINQTTPRHTALMQYNAGTFPATVTPLPLSQRLVISGHSIPDAVARTPLAEAITAMGGTAQKWTATGPHSSASWRWNNPVAVGTPDNVKALMEAPGAAYDAFIGIEAHGGLYYVDGDPVGRASVKTNTDAYVPGQPSDAHAYALLWHNLAASTGAQTHYMSFWRNDPPRVFGAAWRAAQVPELPLWDGIVDYVNANRAAGTQAMRLVPLLTVFCAVYDAIQAGTVTGLTMGGMFSDDVHQESAAGRWLTLSAILAVVYRRHPDTLPANAGTLANIAPALAAQLRPIVWTACLSNPRTGLAA